MDYIYYKYILPSYVYWRGNFRFFHHNDFNENIGIFLPHFPEYRVTNIPLKSLAAK